MKGTCSSRMVRSPVTCTYRQSAWASHTTSSLMRVRTPLPDAGSHQCWTSPSRNCRPAARSRWLARQRGIYEGHCHRILELVAEAVRPRAW